MLDVLRHSEVDVPDSNLAPLLVSPAIVNQTGPNDPDDGQRHNCHAVTGFDNRSVRGQVPLPTASCDVNAFVNTSAYEL